MYLKNLFLTVASIAMLWGCAQTRTNSSETIGNLNSHRKTTFEALGAEKITILGMATSKMDARCSAIDFFEYAVTKYPDADDMLNVRMEESISAKGRDTTYSCKYSGLAISYTPLTVAESKVWNSAYNAKDSSALDKLDIGKKLEQTADVPYYNTNP